MTSNDQALSWMDAQEPDQLYDPESMTFEELRAALETVYQFCYPWHGTDHQVKRSESVLDRLKWMRRITRITQSHLFGER